MIPRMLQYDPPSQAASKSMNVPVVVPKYVLILLLCVNYFVWFGLLGSIPSVHPVQFYGFDPVSTVGAAMEIEHLVCSCQILPSFQLILLPFLIHANPNSYVNYFPWYRRSDP